MYYPTTVQPTSTGVWPNGYQFNTQQQQPVPAMYYQLPPVSVPALPTTTASEVIFQPQQQQQQQQQQQPHTTSVVSKTTTTRILDPSTLPTVASNPPIEETKTITTVAKPGEQTVVTAAGTNVPQVSTKTFVPTAQTTIIRENPQYRTRRTRALSLSTSSDDTTTSSNSTVVPRPEIIQQQIPIQTTAAFPPRRIIHRPQQPQTPSGYQSSDLDYGKRRVYKTDYKYRHFYCCNWCKGRCELRNRSYGCCEWFYGFPLWALIIFGLFFLALLGGFLALFGLQPAVNAIRRSETAETHLVNRSQVVYGFYQNCGYLINATNIPTTLILCTNTATTTTARIQLSPFSTKISGTNSYSYDRILVLFCYLFALKIYQLNYGDLS